MSNQITTTAPPDGTSHLPQLDAVRGIACVMVLIAHLHAVRPLAGIPSVMGPAGVAIFFALSGFLITRGLLTTDRGPNSFYNRRTARILPPYLLTLAAVCMFWAGPELYWAATYSLNLWFKTGTQEYFSVDAADVSIPPLAHVWSLCVEEHFYWVWPTLVWIAPRRFFRWLPVVAVLATPLVTWVMARDLVARDFQPAEVFGLVQRWTPAQTVALSIGCLVAIYERRLTGRIRLFRLQISTLILLGAALVAVSYLGRRSLTTGLIGAEWGMLLGPSILHLGCGGLFVLGMASGWLGSLGWLRSIGKVSYGLYLYHLPIYAAFDLTTTGAVVSWRSGLMAVVCTAVAAVLSYYLVEARLINWVRRNDDRLTVRIGRLRLSVGVALTVCLVAGFAWSTAEWLDKHRVVPVEWRRQVLPPTGTATSAYKWMGVVHHADSNGFRRDSPIPTKQAGVSRVVALGDSLTWGACVESRDTYPTVSEQLLGRLGVHAEVLNCGRRGLQAEDAAEFLEAVVLPLEPDVVIYAATLDDFLPKGSRWGRHSILEWREAANAERFARSVIRMRASCEGAGVAFRVFVMTATPNDSIVREAVRLIEELGRRAGVRVITTIPFLEAYASSNFEVSYWDRHPNATCHRLYAELLVSELAILLDHRTRDAKPR